MENAVTDTALLLERLTRLFTSAADGTRTARTLAARDRDYYDGRQWKGEEAEQLARRGQAAIVVNRIKPKVDYLLGVERQGRTAPRALPRTPQDEGAAEAASQAIRCVFDESGFDRIRSEVFENLLIEGAGFAEVIAEQKPAGVTVTVNHIPWERVFFDPLSRRRDFSDCRYRGQVVWMDLEEATARFPEHAETLRDTLAQPAFGDSYDDLPAAQWVDSRRRLRVVEMWYRDGDQVHQALFTGTTLLKGPVPSPYVNGQGEPEDPYVFCSAFVDRDGARYGVVRQMIDIQDEINKRRSKALHLLSVRQARAEKGAVQDVARAKAELARPDGWIETNPGFSFELLPTGDMAQAQFDLLAEAKSEIDQVAPNASLTGRLDAGASGRALMLRQKGGQMEAGVLFDTLVAWQRRVAGKCFGRIRQFWNSERWVRVTDDPRAPRWVGLNRPVTLGETLIRRFGAIPPHLASDPALAQVVRIEHALARLDVDIVMGDAPDSFTLAGEAFATLTELARSGVPIPPDVLILASPLPDKERLAERLAPRPAPPSTGPNGPPATGVSG